LAGRWPISLFFCHRGNSLCLPRLDLGDHQVVILNVLLSAVLVLFPFPPSKKNVWNLQKAYFIDLVSCSQISLHIIENRGFRWAPRLHLDAETIHCETQVGGDKNHGMVLYVLSQNFCNFA
jgi:hypothetical protein